MAGNPRRDKVSSEVARCLLKELKTVMSEVMEMKRNKDGEALGKAVGVDGPGQRPPASAEKGLATLGLGEAGKGRK